MSFLYLIPFFIAAVSVGVYLEWRSARMDRKAAGLRQANKGPRNG